MVITDIDELIRTMKPYSLVLCALFISSTAVAGKFRLSLGMDYLSGDYGSANTTEIKVATTTARYKHDKWTMQASLPYLEIKGAGVTVDGIPVSGGGGTTARGIGDLNLSLAYLIFYDATAGYGISTKAKVKLPLADEDKGLGTGKTDFSLQIDPFIVLDRTTLFSTIGYKVYGDTSTTDYNNVWFATVGGMYKINDSVSFGLGGNFRKKVTNTSQNKRDIFLFATNKLSDKNRLEFHLLKGFSDSSPDWGGGLAFKRSF